MGLRSFSGTCLICCDDHLREFQPLSTGSGFPAAILEGVHAGSDSEMSIRDGSAYMVTGWDAETSLGPDEFLTWATRYSPVAGSNPTDRMSLGYWLILPRILVRPAGLVVSRSVT